MNIALDSQAKVGDVVYIDGEPRVIVSIESAGLKLEAIAMERIRQRIKTHHGSSAGICALYGQTTGRERRDYERHRAKVAKRKGEERR